MSEWARRPLRIGSSPPQTAHGPYSVFIRARGRSPPSPHDEDGHKKQDARCSGWNVQDEEVCGERAEHDGREQRGSNSPRLRHHDQYAPVSSRMPVTYRNHCPKQTAVKSATISGFPISFAQELLTNTSARNAWTHHTRMSSGRPVAPRVAAMLPDIRLISGAHVNTAYVSLTASSPTESALTWRS